MIKILVVTQEKPTGLNYHRQLIPHSHLDRNYTHEYKIDLTYNINTFSKEDLGEYDIVTFLRIVSHNFDSVEILERCKLAGCKTIIDIDDYWELHPQHDLNSVYSKYKYSEQCLSGLINCDYVTTTTDVFANKIKEYNSNVIVLANSIDTFEPQYKASLIESERIRLSYIAGVFHAPDARLMYEGISDVFKTYDNSKFQFSVGGFNVNDSYKYIEKVFTNDYKNIHDINYLKYLKHYRQEFNEQANFQPYKRLWGADVFNYAKLYNETDVCLVPLVNNEFNNYKSQIKIIEAGHFKKSVIVSNVAPYTIDCTKDNSILINPSKRNDGWGVAMKSMIHNKNRRNDLAESLHEFVKENYYMDKINIVRNQLYKHLCK